jgi:hypothetical protein
MSTRLKLLILAVIAVSAGISTAHAARREAGFTVRSTLDRKKVLPIRIHWIAKTNIRASRVKEIDFLIDGRLAWIEHHAPFVYANDGNWLVTNFLKPGKHVFRVRAISKSGRTTRDTMAARVRPAPAPPAQLAGTWSRTVTSDDLKKCTSQSGCPPTGRWSIKISKRGWSPRDPQGNVGLFDVTYPSATILQMRPTIEYPPYPNSNNGGWCDDTDPLATYSVNINTADNTMTLTATDPCGDRAAILEGTWARPS